MPPKKQKMRLDTLLLDKQFFPSREQARSAIMQGAILVNNIATASLSRNRLKANRRCATESFLAKVIKGSITRLNSLALGKVVFICSDLINELAMLRNIAVR